MKPILKFATLVLLTGMLFHLSCKKEYSCEKCLATNKPPIANAGPDQTILLPPDSATLDGSASRDPDGTISSFNWRKISGPASVTIINASAAGTVVKSLAAGLYWFELKVTDNGGLFAKDTVQITVNDPAQPNRPPVANAGADQTITLPNNSVTLDAGGSSDPDNNISSYAWTKISGPSSFNISNANTEQTQIVNLVQGVYGFELKVTDAGGLSSKDTVQIMVNAQVSSNCVQLIPFSTLSFADYGFKTISAGNKILFTGGWLASRVDIYDTLTQTWSTANLSQERSDFAITTAGNKVFFAGGNEGYGYGFGYTRVDIYDAVANTWSTAELSQGRSLLAAASVGNKVYFGGGWSYDYGISDLVDIYDISSGTWSISHLSEARSKLSAVSLNHKIYFAGGATYTSVSSKIDVYDALTNSWSTTTMAEPKMEMASIAVGNKIIWAGGENMPTAPFWSTMADVFDVNTGSHTLHQMSSTTNSSYNNNVVRKENKIIFLTQENDFKIDVYDLNTETWSVCEIYNHSPIQGIIAIGNKAFGAVGWQNGNYINQVWKLEF